MYHCVVFVSSMLLYGHRCNVTTHELRITVCEEIVLKFITDETSNVENFIAPNFCGQIFLLFS